tara:strand:+ start:1608 stop:2450 length:843 start_codon:yes stop_codon:yes gene_type:complete
MLNLKERAKGRKTKSKIIPDKTIKIKKQTPDFMSKKKDKKAGPGQRDKLKKFQKIKQKIRPKQNPFISSANPGDIPIKSKIKKSIVDAKSPRTGRATRTTKPVTGNIGEIKTKNKSNKIEEKRRQRKSLLKNIGEFKTSGPTKIQEERKKRVRKTTFPVKDKSIKTSSKISEIEKEKFRKPVPGNRPGAVDTSRPSIVDKSKRGKPTTTLDKIKTRAKMVMDNVARSADNLYPSKQAKDIVIRKSVGGRLDDLGYEEVDKRPTSKNNRSYRGYGKARQGN